MEPIRNFIDLLARLSQRQERKRVAVIWPEDENTQFSMATALAYGFADAIFIGCRQCVEANPALCAYADHISFIEAATREEAALTATRLAREGKADILMKGLINTDSLLRFVLDKETGILPPGRVLTHLTAALLPDYPRFLFFSDSAVIPSPTQAQRIEQVRYAVNVCHAFGVEVPKVSLIHCTEKVNGKHFPFTLGYQDIVTMARQGAFGPCVVDGPLDLKTSISPESMRIKGIDSPIAGEADALIFPDIESANVFYKSITFFCGVETAGALQGTMVPVVLPSRSDNRLTKFFSLALAAV